MREDLRKLNGEAKPSIYSDYLSLFGETHDNAVSVYGLMRTMCPGSTHILGTCTSIMHWPSLGKGSTMCPHGPIRTPLPHWNVYTCRNIYVHVDKDAHRISNASNWYTIRACLYEPLEEGGGGVRVLTLTGVCGV